MEREIRLRVIDPNTKKVIGIETWDIYENPELIN